MHLENKRIIVTGGASGMAAASVRLFTREGGSVVSLDVDDKGGAAVARQATEAGPGRADFVGCDVSSGSDVAAAFRRAAEILGGLDVLANCAGLEQAVPPETLTEADMDRMLDVHVKGTMFTNQQAFELMRERGGAIVNFGSVAGVDGAPDSAGYATAKGGVLAWTRSAARAWGRHGIRVNAVCPMIRTPMYSRYRSRLTPQQQASADRALAVTIPLGGTLGDPDRDLAPVMVFLASDASRFITGQTIPVDGGMLLMR